MHAGPCRLMQNASTSCRLQQITTGIFPIFISIDNRDHKSAQCDWCLNYEHTFEEHVSASLWNCNIISLLILNKTRQSHSKTGLSLTLATAVIGISNWFLFVHLVNMLCSCHIYSEQREWDSWGHKPSLTDCTNVCAFSIAHSTFANWSIVSLLMK